MPRSSGTNYARAGPIRFPFEGIVVVKRGKGAIIYCSSLGLCLLSRSNHCVGQWISFDTFNPGNFEGRSADINHMVDLSKFTEIDCPVPTFAAFRNKCETPVLFLSSFDEAEYFICEQGPQSLPRFTSFPCFVYRKPPPVGGALSSWAILKDTSNILPLKNSANAIPVIDYLDKVSPFQDRREPEPIPLPSQPIPLPPQPRSVEPDQQIVSEAAGAVRRLMSHPQIRELIREYDVVAYRKLQSLL